MREEGGCERKGDMREEGGCERGRRMCCFRADVGLCQRLCAWLLFMFSAICLMAVTQGNVAVPYYK